MIVTTTTGLDPSARAGFRRGRCPGGNDPGGGLAAYGATTRGGLAGGDVPGGGLAKSADGASCPGGRVPIGGLAAIAPTLALARESGVSRAVAAP